MEGQAGPDPLATWELSQVALTASSLAYGEGVFVAEAARSETIFGAYSSTNGLDWLSTRSLGQFGKVAYGGGRFVLAENWERGVEVSADGYGWQEVLVEMYGDLSDLFHYRSQFWFYGRATFSDAHHALWTSTDGLSWKTNKNQPDTFGWRFLPGNGRIVASDGSEVRVSPDGLRWTTLTNDPGRLIYPLIYGHGTYFAISWVTRSNRLQVVGLTSKDLRNWTEHDIPQTDSLSHGFYANGTFVTHGDRGEILTSPDAETWTLRAIPTNRIFSCATFGQGRFVLGGEGIIRSGVMPPAVDHVGLVPRLCRRLEDGAMLLTVEAPYGQRVGVEASEDLMHWQLIASDPCDKGEFEVYDEDAKNRQQRFYRARQGGEFPQPNPLNDWRLAPKLLENYPSAGQRARLAYGNGTFVAVCGGSSSDSGTAYASPDGRTWTRTSTAGHRDVVFGGGQFVSVGRSPYTSSDGQVWTARSGTLLGGPGVAFGRGAYLVLSYDATGSRRLSSVDGVSWSDQALGGLTWVTPIRLLYGGGLWVGAAECSILISADGASWQERYKTACLINWPGDFEYLYRVAYGRGRYVAVGFKSLSSNHSVVVTSSNGVDWVLQPKTQPAPDRAVTYANGVFLGVGATNSISVVFTSLDGITWTKQGELGYSWVEDVVFGQGRFVVVTEGGGTARSGLMPPHVAQVRVMPEWSRRLADGAQLVTVEGPYGKAVVVESSLDGSAWKVIATDPCDRGEFEVYDEEAMDGKPRFYRARQAGP